MHLGHNTIHPTPYSDLEITSNNLTKGVYICIRTDGEVFNLSKLRACTKIRGIFVHGLLYATNSALVANDPDDMQEIVDYFVTVATIFGLRIIVMKMELLYQPLAHLRNVEDAQATVFCKWGSSEDYRNVHLPRKHSDQDQLCRY